MAAFVARVPVRFGDVDYARIVYYPRLLHLLHIAFEDLFAHHVGVPYARLIEERHLGFPSASLHFDFHAPIRFGEELRVAFTVTRLGTSSVELHQVVTVTGDEDRRVTGTMTRVAVDMRTLRPIPIPDDLRRAFAALT